MVQLEGKYVHSGNEGLEEYLRTIGGEEHAKASMALMESQPIISFYRKGDAWVVDFMTKDGKIIYTEVFTDGVPYDDEKPHGGSLPCKSVTTIDGLAVRTVTDLPDGNKSIRESLFAEEGVTVHLSDIKYGVKAVRHYKRI